MAIVWSAFARGASAAFLVLLAEGTVIYLIVYKRYLMAKTARLLASQKRVGEGKRSAVGDSERAYCKQAARKAAEKRRRCR